MKVLYLTTVDLSDRSAQSLQIIEMSSAFNKVVNFELIAFASKALSGLNFTVNINTEIRFNKLRRSAKLIKFTLLNRGKSHFIFTRDFYIAFILSFLGYKCVWECHQKPSRLVVMLVKIFRLLRVRNLKILTISKALRDSDFFTLPKDLLFYYHDCASDREINNDKLPPFDAKIIKNSPREKVAVYTGALHKGLDFDSLKPLFGRYKNWTFLIYGGKDEAEINEYRHRYAKFDNVTFLGRRTKGEILAIQESADVLLYPLTVSNKLYRYTSPLKLFEYMNSGRPIIASRIGSITEILNEENAYCYTDDILSAAARFEAATDAEKYKKSELNKSLILNKYNWLKRVKYISENCFN